ncbi:hypothetical protein M406DRAFT_262928 [Cryphonectria parasitica EP155]|uniref:Uncharacterized protein n=1 Tax=Cryphonectria parasitica (strain ATCC 38755 / EP155) TaxID=660469 RepID=A0A9P4Y0G2_CRYP1|nr:uncharacterized protein M406DRAFT_262928 [Cryphonectria parasitica EP155]KAF3763875.1 hypothetical protein M406DRAFT_262928 [Cryphonectria parasitica EP155]
MAHPRGGHNPAWGRDTGPPPPTSRQAYGGYSFPYPNGAAQYYPPVQYPYWGYGNQPWTYPMMNAAQQPLAPASVQQPPAFANTARMATGQPVIDASLPAANMTNSTGGVGCEPGYNYFFPSEHTKIHVFRTGDTPPWNLPPHFVWPFHTVHVPTNTTLASLLKGFGAVNPDPRKNRVTECHQGGNGRWYKGMSFGADEEDNMNKQIKEVGWDKTRTGLPGGKPVVHLYVTKG